MRTSIADGVVITEQQPEKVPDYIVRKSGSYYRATSGATAKIVFGSSRNIGGVSGSSAYAVLLATINALDQGGGAGCRGHIHVETGIFEVDTSIIPNAGNGNLFITGNGMRSTILKWTGLTNDYLLDFDATGFITLKDLEVQGGASGSEVGRGIRFKRDLAGEGCQAFLHNVKVSYCVDPAVKFYYTQDSVLLNTQFNGNTGFDLDCESAAHVNIYGGTIQKAKVDSSLFKMFGGTLSHINIVQDQSYGTVLFGISFDPVPTGYVSHVIVGSAGRADMTNISACNFIGEPEAGGYFIDLVDGKDTTIGVNNYLTTYAGTYINVQAGSENTLLQLPEEFDVTTKLADAGTRTTVYWRGRIYGTHTTEGNTVITNGISGNRIEMANSDKHLILRLNGANGATATMGLESLNGAGGAYLTRLSVSNKADVARVSIGEAAFKFPTVVHVTPVEGDAYWDTVAHKLKVFNGAGWETVTSA